MEDFSIEKRVVCCYAPHKFLRFRRQWIQAIIFTESKMFRIKSSSIFTSEFTHLNLFSIHQTFNFGCILDSDGDFGVFVAKHASIIDISRSHYNDIIIHDHQLAVNVDYLCLQTSDLVYGMLSQRKELDVILDLLLFNSSFQQIV